VFASFASLGRWVDSLFTRSLPLCDYHSYTELVYKRHRGVAKKLKKIVEIEERSKDSTVRLQEDQKVRVLGFPPWMPTHQCLQPCISRPPSL
jgi:hypothetical protein